MYLFKMQTTKVMLIHSIVMTRTPSGTPTATPTVVTWPLEMGVSRCITPPCERLDVVGDVAMLFVGVVGPVLSHRKNIITSIYNDIHRVHKNIQ